MSTIPEVSSYTPNFQPILDKALKEYRKKTGKELDTHPLAAAQNWHSHAMDQTSLALHRRILQKAAPNALGKAKVHLRNT